MPVNHYLASVIHTREPLERGYSILKQDIVKVHFFLRKELTKRRKTI